MRAKELNKMETETIQTMTAEISEGLKDIAISKRARAKFLRAEFNRQVAESEARWQELLRQR
jgi:hypothetical protein